VNGSASTLLEVEAEHVTRINGTFRVYVADHEGSEHIVLVRGDVRNREGVLCRVSSACVMSTALGSAECDCMDQLSAAMDLISNYEHGGIIIYLMDQEGRGHGLKWKIRALKHKNEGMDTFAAVEHLGLPPDIRDYTIVPRILDELEVGSVTLLTNNPDKRDKIQRAGVHIKETQPLEVCPPQPAWRHMEAKRVRGHALTTWYIDAEAVGSAVPDGHLPVETSEHGYAPRGGLKPTVPVPTSPEPRRS
jgi:GTP cyclohydrolase II